MLGGGGLADMPGHGSLGGMVSSGPPISDGSGRLRLVMRRAVGMRGGLEDGGPTVGTVGWDETSRRRREAAAPRLWGISTPQPKIGNWHDPCIHFYH